MRRHPGDELASANHETRLGAPEELVSAEEHDVGAVVEHLADPRLISEPSRGSPFHPGNPGIEQAAPHVGDERHIGRPSDPGDVRPGRRLGEALDPVVGRMDHDQSVDVTANTFVVLGTGAVGGADLHESHPGGRHQLREPE